MYSVLPLVASASHIGFVLALVLFVGFMAILVAWTNDFGWSPITATLAVLLVAFMASVTTASFGIEEPKPQNIAVVAKFVGYIPEEQQYACGKNNGSRCYTSRVYGVFELPEGRVSLQISGNVPIPEYVYLYKN